MILVKVDTFELAKFMLQHPNFLDRNFEWFFSSQFDFSLHFVISFIYFIKFFFFDWFPWSLTILKDD